MTWYWHAWYNVVIEKLDDIQERIEYIKRFAPKNDVERRLKLLKPAKGVERVWAKYEKTENSARKKYMKIKHNAWFEYEKIVKQVLYGEKKPRDEKLAKARYGKIDKRARAEYHKTTQSALAEYRKTIERLHKEQCGCKEWNGAELVFQK